MDLETRLRRVQFIVCDVDGVLTDGLLFFDGEGRPFRAVHARDAAAFTVWRASGGKIALVTGMGSAAVEAVAKLWQCEDCVTWVKDKGRVCRELSEQHGVPLEEMAFLGDDLIDLTAMRIVGLAVAVADAASEAKAEAHWVTTAPGGRGPLRELVYRILSVRGELESAVAQYCNRKDGEPAAAGGETP